MLWWRLLDIKKLLGPILGCLWHIHTKLAAEPFNERLLLTCYYHIYMCPYNKQPCIETVRTGWSSLECAQSLQDDGNTSTFHTAVCMMCDVISIINYCCIISYHIVSYRIVSYHIIRFIHPFIHRKEGTWVRIIPPLLSSGCCCYKRVVSGAVFFCALWR